jgi:ADP-ribosylglycohydrolase
VGNAVGILDTHRHMPPLTSSLHRFWVESDEKEPYHEHSLTSLAASGVDAKSHVYSLLEAIQPNSAEARAFWAIVGALVADAAAQPTHWNYKISYFHDDLWRRNRWYTPEFLRPSMNTYYHIPMGSNSCYGDQAREVLLSLVECGALDPHALERRFVSRFSEDGDYGPLPQEGLYNGNKQHVRELPITGPWRHISIAGFLKNVKQGRHYPDCGTGDAQADCFVRIVPVVALYAGHPDLLEKVAEAVGITQDNPPALAVGQAFARILEGIILGTTGMQAISQAIEEFGRRESELDGFRGRVAGTMRKCAMQSGTSLYDAVLGFGGGSYSTAQVS